MKACALMNKSPHSAAAVLACIIRCDELALPHNQMENLLALVLSWTASDNAKGIGT